MSMKSEFILISTLVLVACGQNKDSEKKESGKVNWTWPPEEQKPATRSEPEIVQDSVELAAFWEQAVHPILIRDKESVLKNMDFPILGHWTAMMEMDIDSEVATRKDFEGIYDRFFSDYFVDLLSKKDRKEFGAFLRNNKTAFGFNVQDSTGQSAVFLIFYKTEGVFKLKEVQGAGGNFYGWTKPTQPPLPSPGSSH